MEWDELLVVELAKLQGQTEFPADTTWSACTIEVLSGNGVEIETALIRAETVMLVVAELSAIDEFPEVHIWRRSLPEWFIQKFARDQTDEELRAYRARWDSMSEYERQQRSRLQHQWTLKDWIYWFQPEMRTWVWGGTEVLDKATADVTIYCDGELTAIGALEWLLRASGVDPATQTYR